MGISIERRHVGQPRGSRVKKERERKAAHKKSRQYLMKHRTVNKSDTPRLRAGQIKSTAQTKASKAKTKTAARRKK